MKRFLFLFALVFGCIGLKAQDYSLSASNIGPFKLEMLRPDAQKFSKTKLAYKGASSTTTVDYKGSKVDIGFFESPEYDALPKGTLSVIYLSTKSPKFKTKKGIGVSSTKAQVLAAYKTKDFNVKQEASQIVVRDAKLSSKMYFKIAEGKVTEVEIMPDVAD